MNQDYNLEDEMENTHIEEESDIVDTYDSFEDMGLDEKLLRGIFSYILLLRLSF